MSGKLLAVNNKFQGIIYYIVVSSYLKGKSKAEFSMVMNPVAMLGLSWMVKISFRPTLFLGFPVLKLSQVTVFL
jgi:hypothetical protein